MSSPQEAAANDGKSTFQLVGERQGGVKWSKVNRVYSRSSNWSALLPASAVDTDKRGSIERSGMLHPISREHDSRAIFGSSTDPEKDPENGAPLVMRSGGSSVMVAGSSGSRPVSPAREPCPKCQSTGVHRSRRRGLVDRVRGLMGFLPYRCHVCGLRFFRRKASQE